MDCASRAPCALIITAHLWAPTARRRVMGPRPEELARVVDREREDGHMSALRALCGGTCVSQQRRRPRTRRLLKPVSACQFVQLLARREGAVAGEEKNE